MFLNKALFLKSNLIVLGIVILAFMLRWHNYAQFPVIGETQDELAWTWMGTSILQGNHPTTWSGTNLTGYDVDYSVDFQDQTYRIISPYLDNPHLFSIIPGSIAIIRGFADIEIPSMKVIRFPMILIGTLNVFLLYLVAHKLFSRNIALLATALYATIPTIVFTSRVVVAENLLITFLLLSLFFTDRYLKQPSDRIVVLLGILGGLSALTKVAGLVIPIGVSLVFFSYRKFKAGLIVLVLSATLGSLYFIYGFLVNPQLFSSVLAKQSDFGIGLATVLNMFIYPQLVQKTFMDGWVYLGLISLIFVIISQTTHQSTRMVAMFSVVQLGFILAATPEVISHGWYKYPLFPLMALSIPLLIQQYRNNPAIITVIGILVLLPIIRLFILVNHLTLPKIILRVLMGSVFITALLPQYFQHQKVAKKLVNYILVVAIALNILVVLGMQTPVYWEDSLYFFPVRSGL